MRPSGCSRQQLATSVLAFGEEVVTKREEKKKKHADPLRATDEENGVPGKQTLFIAECKCLRGGKELFLADIQLGISLGETTLLR